MSTLKTVNVVHPSSSTNNIVTDANGNVTVGGTVSMASSFLRNRVINGAMEIDQRNAGASSTPAASGYLIDRFAWAGSVGSKLTFGQNLNSVTPPTGFTKYLGAQTASATTPTASEFYALYQVIEGLNMVDLAWGTSSAKTVTLSFLARSSLTGTFGGSIYNGAANRSYPFSYSIPSANTWTQISVTIPGDTTGTWATDDTAGAIIMFGLGAAAAVSGTAGAWAAGLYRSSTGAVQVVANASATFYITGVQLEVGSVATPFERRLFGTELQLAQRYCYVMRAQGGYTPFGYGAFVNTSDANVYTAYPITMRASPTIAYSAANTFYMDGAGSPSIIQVDQIGPYSMITILKTGGSYVASSPTRWLANNNSTALVTITAEL